MRDESRVCNAQVIKIVTLFLKILFFSMFIPLPGQVKSITAARNSYLKSDIPTHILLRCLHSID